MKTLKTILTVMLLTLSLNSFADGGNSLARSGKSSKSSYGIQYQMSKLLNLPSQVITTELHGEVDVTFRVNEMGWIQVVHVEGTTPETVERVERVLRKTKLHVAPEYVGKTFKFNLNYDH